MPRPRSSLVKGSHIVVPPALRRKTIAYIFQNADGRIFFVIPYERRLLPDRHHRPADYEGDPASVAAPRPRRWPTCAAAGRPISGAPVTPDQVVWTYSGVAPAVRRRRLEGGRPRPATTCSSWTRPPARRRCSSVFGGKITTFRRLAEAALAKLAPLSCRQRDRLSTRAGPASANICRAAISGRNDFEAAIAAMRPRPGYPFVAPQTMRHLLRAYGYLRRRSGTEAGAASLSGDRGQTGSSAPT